MILANIAAAALLGGWVLTTAVSGETGTEARLRVLVVTGGHGYDVEGFQRMLAADPETEWHHRKHPEALEMITGPAGKDFDVVLLYDMYQPITADQKTRYEDCIRRGKGIVALHHSLASFQAWPEYERIIGGKYFLGAPPEDGSKKPSSTFHHDRDIPVEIADRDHFITRGLEDFVIHDETYKGFRTHPAVHALLRTSHPQSGPVLGWAKPYGKSRVVYLQLGHDDSAYSNPNYRQLVFRAVRWVARRTPEDAGRLSLMSDSLTGWSEEGKARFSVEDGILEGRQGPGGTGGELFTEEEYSDFELEVTWAMSWPGNSGVWFRYQSPEQAYQADILEWRNPECWSGTVYCPGKMFLALNRDPSIVDRDGWNTFVVRAEGDRIAVHLNGRKVAEVRDGSSARGRIGIQVHAGEKFSDSTIRVADLRILPLK